MKMHVADVNGRLVAVMGDESTMEAAIKKAETGSPPTSGPIADALAMAGGKPTLLVHVEGRQLLRGAMALARKMMPEQAESSGMPEIPEGKPLDLVVYATGGGRYYAGGFSMDVGALKDIVEAFTSAGH